MATPSTWMKGRDKRRLRNQHMQAGILLGMQLKERESIPPVLITITNIARAFRVTPRTILNWMKCGMPHSKNGQGQVVAVFPIVEAWLLRWKKDREDPRTIASSLSVDDQVKMVLSGEVPRVNQ